MPLLVTEPDTHPARGPGLFLWKPYIIDRVLADLHDGDVLFYSDPGCKFRGDPEPWLAAARQHGWLGFRMPHPTQKWTKGDVFAALGTPMEEYGTKGQFHAYAVVIKASPVTRAFVKEWLDLCTNPKLITDEESRTPNHPSFQDHRHAAAIYTLLVSLPCCRCVFVATTFRGIVSPPSVALARIPNLNVLAVSALPCPRA